MGARGRNGERWRDDAGSGVEWEKEGGEEKGKKVQSARKRAAPDMRVHSLEFISAHTTRSRVKWHHGKGTREMLSSTFFPRSSDQHEDRLDML